MASAASASPGARGSGSTDAVRRRPRPTSRGSAGVVPRRGAGAAPRIHWNRLGGLAMLCVVGALLYLYLSAGLTLFSTWREARQDSAQVQALERQHRSLQVQHAALISPGTLVEEARRLGMVRSGEQLFVITGLPAN
jgi:hypothetical protein